MAGSAQRVHLADFLVQRAAGEGDAEHRFLELAGLAVLQALAAGVLALGVAPDAVVDLVQRLLGVHAVIGQGKALAVPPVMFGQAQHGDAVALDRLDRHQMLRVDPARDVEQRAAVMGRLPGRGQRGPGGVAQGFVQRLRVGFPGGDLRGEGAFGQWRADAGFQRGAQGRAVEAGRIGVFLHRLTLHEQALAGVDRVQCQGFRGSARRFLPRCRTVPPRSRPDAGLVRRRDRIRRGWEADRAWIVLSAGAGAGRRHSLPRLPGSFCRGGSGRRGRPDHRR